MFWLALTYLVFPVALLLFAYLHYFVVDRKGD